MKPGPIEETLYKAGHVLFNEGDDGGSLYFVKEGRLEIYRIRDGNSIHLGYVNAGDVLGTVTLFSKESRTASARVIMPATVICLTSTTLESLMATVPVWFQALLKDAIARLKYVDERLVETTLKEKNLLQKVGTPMHHASQMAGLLSALMRLGTINEDDIELFPLRGFIPRAEQVLHKRAEYLEVIFDAFMQGGLIKSVQDKKYGPSVQKPKPQILDDFSVFALQVARVGIEKFAPVKMYAYMSGLVRAQKKFPDKSSFTPEELCDCLGKEMGRTITDALLAELLNHDVLRKMGDSFGFTANQLQRRIVFESVCRTIHDAAPVG